MDKRSSHAEALLVHGTSRTPRALYLLAVVLIGVVVWCHLTPVDVFVRAPGVVRPEGEVVRIASETGGRVEVVRVREGAMVETGEVLVHLGTTDEQMKKRTLTHQINLLDAQLNHLRGKLEVLDRIHSAEQARLDAEERAARESLERQVAEFRATLESARIRLDQAGYDHRTTNALFDEGLVSRVAWTTSRADLRLAESNYNRAATGTPDRGAIELHEKARALADTQFAADRQDLTAAIYPIEVELAELRLQLDYADQEELRHTIRSPARGQVALLEDIHPGEHLPPGAVIGTLEPTPKTRVVEAVLSNINARDVHPSQSVRLLLDDAQIVDGTVLSISPDVRLGDSTAGTYKVLIVPASTDLRLGQALEVRFITRRETVLTLLTGRITESFRQLGG